MNMIKRFTFYLGGFGIGILIVFFFLSGKDVSCSYFPNARVLNEIRSKNRAFAPEALNFFKENKIDTIAVTKLLNQGSVKFKQSQTDRDKPCRNYVINGSHKQQELQIEVEQCKETDSIATINKARFRE